MIAFIVGDTGMRISRFVLAIIAVSCAGAVRAGASEDFAQLVDEAWQAELVANPVFASQLGDTRYNRRWPDLRPAAIEQRQQQKREFLRRAYSIDRNALDESDRLNYELFRRSLQDTVDSYQFNGELMPLHHRGGVQNLDSTTNFLNFASIDDYEDWLARMAAVDDYVEQTINLADRGRREGYVPPRILMERIPGQLGDQLVDDPEDSPFYRAFDNLPAWLSEAERARLQSAARETIRKSILPAYRKLDRWFEKTYLPAARDSIGMSALPNGDAWYDYRARRYTTTRMSPGEIHRLGLSEVRRIRDEMERIIEELGFNGDFADFLDFLRTDEKFYYDDPEKLYEAYLATSKRIDPQLVQLFGKLPRMPYGVKPIPDSIAPDTTTAYYNSPAADGSRAGIYWVNLYRPDVRPKYEIEVLTVHEAVPGHHLQLALQQEISDLPAFRRYGGFTAFIEGWALYAEGLGYELGLYEDPYSRFGQLTYEMWRAVRLVVDTGIHSKGWTRQQAIDFFKANAAKSELDIVNEIDRYIGNAGQALAYKIGQLRIAAIRQQAEMTLGDDFDIRAFHDQLLGAGALPLDLLEQRMDEWVSGVERN